MVGGIVGHKHQKDSFVKGSGLGSELESFKYKPKFENINQNTICEQNENYDEIKIEHFDMNEG